MDMKDNISLLISVSSACAAVLSVIFSKLTLNRQRYMQGWIANHDLLNRTTAMLVQDHSLLLILGIDPEELIKDGITPEELIFIHASLDAGHAFYRISGERYSIITGYRKNFLENLKVRLVWKKYLRDKLFGDTAWTKAVDAYIAEFEARTGQTIEVREVHEELQSRLGKMPMEASWPQASAVQVRLSKSLASLWQLLSQSNVRSAIQRLSRTSKPAA
jgi:hypothetical protein